MNTVDILNRIQRTRDLVFTAIAARGFANFGRGSRILLPSRLSGTAHISIGERVLVGAGSWLTVPHAQGKGPHLILHDRVRMNTTSISAVERVEIEEAVAIARGCYISDHSHGFADPGVPIRDQPLDRIAPVLIKRGAWLGQNVVVMPGVTIGRGSVIGANSVVRSDVPDRTVAAGVPARILRELP
ncbi:acyltransferase [Microbacterium sp. ET2]|uniref:acyltransferase n=1 Tax=Microbacterium albipurpureum TaxID=3050384 RepID=UPI00259C9A85|nr:acyltransferase [Microbacterium sp. ET2 (Ac-2212)]WJL94740.1 acyltransferase [Microbacterium sp. ET2 (Ac-2212)]